MDYLNEIINQNKFKLLGIFTLFSGLYIVKKKLMGGNMYQSLKRLDEKSVIVTGANSGIGYEIALDFSKRGANVILACRDKKKALKALEAIKNESKNKNIYFEELDLASLESVKQFCMRVLSKYQKINILVNNAGVAWCPYWITQDKFEYQFQVNFLSHYLLTRLLVNKLAESSSNDFDSRIINVTSKLYESSKIELNDVNFTSRKYLPVEGYKQSKLCNILFTNYLNEIYLKSLHAEQKIHAFSVSPGVVLTNLGQHSINSSIFKKIAACIFYPLLWFLLKTPKQGAQTIIFCAIEDNLHQGEGKYFRNLHQFDLKSNATSKDDSVKLWNLSEKFVSKYL